MQISHQEVLREKDLLGKRRLQKFSKLQIIRYGAVNEEFCFVGYMRNNQRLYAFPVITYILLEMSTLYANEILEGKKLETYPTHTQELPAA